MLKEEGDTKSGPLHIHNDGARVHDNAHATSRATEIMPHSTTLQTRKEIYSSQGSIVELYPLLWNYIYAFPLLELICHISVVWYITPIILNLNVCTAKEN